MIEPAGATILIVEDEKAIVRLCRSVLEASGYRVLSPDGVEEALELLGRGEPVDLLLTDVRMPGMSGRELAKRARALHPGLRVVFMSGYPDESLTHETAPRARFLGKPFTPMVLLRVLQDLLER